MRVNPKITSLALLLISIPLLTACNFKIPTNLDELKHMLDSDKQTAQSTHKDVSDTSKDSEKDSPFQVSQDKKAGSTMSKLEALLNRHKSMVCTYEDENGSVVMLTDGKNLKIIMHGEINGTPYEATSLILDDTIYSWNNTQKAGMKMPISEVSDEDDKFMPVFPKMDIIDEGSVDEDVEYACKEKALDSDTFKLPEDITFHEFTVPEISEKGQIDMCSICENVNEVTEKDACKAQFGCK